MTFNWGSCRLRDAAVLVCKAIGFVGGQSPEAELAKACLLLGAQDGQERGTGCLSTI